VLLGGKSSREPGVLWVGDVVGPCLRCGYLGVVKPRAASVERGRLFRVGGLLEGFWVGVLRGLGFHVVGVGLGVGVVVGGLRARASQINHELFNSPARVLF